MNTSLFNILWIDDQHQDESGFKAEAIDFGLKLCPFKSLDGGVSELERNYPQYDGVLLDAKFLEREDSVPGTEHLRHIFAAKDKIAALPKPFKIFVLTGQVKTYQDETFNMAFDEVYSKLDRAEREQLWTKLSHAADGQRDTQIRRKHQRVFNACTARYLGEAAGRDLLELLKDAEDKPAGGSLNTLRKMVEDVFCALAELGTLPVAFVSPQVALNPASKFLAGKGPQSPRRDSGVIYENDQANCIPVVVSNLLQTLLQVTQTGSHRSTVDIHMNNVRSPYLFQSALMQLMEIIVWFKDYADTTPGRERWSESQQSGSAQEGKGASYVGTVINLNAKGFAFLKLESGEPNIFIPPTIVHQYGLNEGAHIRAEIEEYVDNRSGEVRIRVRNIDGR